MTSTVFLAFVFIAALAGYIALQFIRYLWALKVLHCDMLYIFKRDDDDEKYLSEKTKEQEMLLKHRLKKVIEEKFNHKFAELGHEGHNPVGIRTLSAAFPVFDTQESSFILSRRIRFTPSFKTLSFFRITRDVTLLRETGSINLVSHGEYIEVADVPKDFFQDVKNLQKAKEILEIEDGADEDENTDE